jgi:transcriptional regulator GlxA family with amidase domain
MPLVLMIKQEVEKADGHQYNYHKRTIFANEESISVVYNCSLSLAAEDRHKILKTEDNRAHRLTSISSSIFLIGKKGLILYS